MVIGLIPELNIFKQKARFTLLGRVPHPEDRGPGAVHDPVALREHPRELRVRAAGRRVLRLVHRRARDREARGRPARTPREPRRDLDLPRLPLRPEGQRVSTTPPACAGKRMAFVDRATTAGYVFPLAWLQRARDLRRRRASSRSPGSRGSHDAAITAVLERKADVGAAKHSVYDRVRGKNPRVDQRAAHRRVLAAGAVQRALRAARSSSRTCTRRSGAPCSTCTAIRDGANVLAQFGATPVHRDDARPTTRRSSSSPAKAGIDLKRYQYRNE